MANRLAAQYVNGYVFFMREGTLLAQALDAGRLQLKGEPVPVAEHVGTTGILGVFSVSASGALAYRTGGPAGAVFQLTWFDRQGKTLGTFGEPGSYIGFALSPDGKGMAYRDAPSNSTGETWTRDFEHGIRAPLTSAQTDGSFPVRSPDGTRIAFALGITGALYERDSSGVSKQRELLKKPGEAIFPTSWSRDRRFLLYYVANNPKTSADIWVLPLEGDPKPVLLLGTQFNESQGSFSPDMRWIAYTSDDSGRSEIYVRPFISSGSSGGFSLGPTLGDDKLPMSKDGGTLPKWTADGKELIYRAPDGSPMAMDVSAGPAHAKAATRLFPLRRILGTGM
jgi:eukaryotic-like serine/threonine-protein kinase